MDGWGLFVAILVAYAAVAVPILGWAVWRLRRPGPVTLHPAVPALLLVLSLGLLTAWILRSDWLGVISSTLLATSFAISLRHALVRRSSG